MKNLHILLSALKLASIHNFTVMKLTYNKNWKSIINILYTEGYIQNYFIQNSHIVIYFRYYNKTSCIRQVNSFLNYSHFFIKKKNLWLFNSKQGTLVLSTTEGVKTHTECLEKNLGGKVLFFIC